VSVAIRPETETEIYYDIRLSNELVGRLLYIDSIYTRISN
jgi:hypothetical protein